MLIVITLNIDKTELYVKTVVQKDKNQGYLMLGKLIIYRPFFFL